MSTKYHSPLGDYIAHCVSVPKYIHSNHTHGQNTFWHRGEEWVLPPESFKKGRKNPQNVHHLMSLISWIQDPVDLACAFRPIFLQTSAKNF